VPPRLVASYYLDQARSHTERVTIPLLEAALARTVDGARRMVALHDGAAAVKRPSPACRWCALLPDCTEGTALMHELDGLD